MKLALDVWYELWENAGSVSGRDLTQQNDSSGGALARSRWREKHDNEEHSGRAQHLDSTVARAKPAKVRALFL